MSDTNSNMSFENSMRQQSATVNAIIAGPGTLFDIVTEKELLRTLGIGRSTLDEMRLKHQLPFCKVTDRCRLYFVGDVLEFLKGRTVILNRSK